jgi:hypothetical protein
VLSEVNEFRVCQTRLKLFFTPIPGINQGTAGYSHAWKLKDSIILLNSRVEEPFYVLKEKNDSETGG